MNFEDIAGASIDITQEFVVELVDHAVVTPPKSKVCELCGKVLFY